MTLKKFTKASSIFFVYTIYSVYTGKRQCSILKYQRTSSRETSSKFCVQKLHFKISVTEDPSAKPNRSFKQKLILTCKYFANLSSAKISPYK